MKLEVLIIASEFPPGPGGIGSHAYSMACAMQKKRCDVVVLANGDYVTQDEIKKFDSKLPFRVIRYPDGRLGLKYLKRLISAIKLRRRNVIVSGKFSLWIGAVIKRLYPSINLISILHGSEVNLANSFTRHLTHRSIATSDIIVTVSKFTRGLLPKSILSSHKVEIIPNGISLEKLYDDGTSDKLIGEPSILTVGNVTPRKGQHRVIKSLPQILKRYPNAHYHIVGLPTFRDQFEALAKSLGVENHVTFHGRAETSEDLFNTYKGADIFAILSENQNDGDCEGFGIVVLEAGYFGVPSIGAKGCGIEDAIKNGYNGFLVDGDDSEEICNAISETCNNRDRLSASARKWANEHDWDYLSKDIIKLLLP